MATKRTPKAVKAAPLTITHVLHDYARPVAGARLAAHTAAFLTLTGMAAGKPCPSATAMKVIGPTAVKYHRLIGNWESTADGLKLTDKGMAFFSARGEPDAELFAAYQKVMTTGEADERVAKADSVVKL